MKKITPIIVIICMLCACKKQNIQEATNLDVINTANSKSYKGGNIVDDRVEMVRKAENLKINAYSNSNIKIKIFQED